MYWTGFSARSSVRMNTMLDACPGHGRLRRRARLILGRRGGLAGGVCAGRFRQRHRRGTCPAQSADCSLCSSPPISIDLRQRLAPPAAAGPPLHDRYPQSASGRSPRSRRPGTKPAPRHAAVICPQPPNPSRLRDAVAASATTSIAAKIPPVSAPAVVITPVSLLTLETSGLLPGRGTNRPGPDSGERN
jgi:hypothetical protein